MAKSVQAKFLLYVVSLVLVSTVVVFELFEWNSRRTAEQQLQAKLDKLIDIQSSVLAQSLWNVADQKIKLILSALLTDPDVLAAAVYDERDRLVAEVGETQGFETTRFAEKRDIYYDAGDQDVRIGELRIALSDAKLTTLAGERLTLAIVLAGILLAAIVAARLTANRRIIGRPLELLMASINQAHFDGPRKPVAGQSDDGIGHVVAAFNDMEKRQNAYEQQLRTANDELEARVQERSAELAGAEATAREACGLLTNTINQKVGRKILKRLGFDPVVVGSGEEAIAACRADDYDIVLMDIEMPDMDGIAATNRIREIIPDARAPHIVALMANAMNSERGNYLKSRMDDYLSKPIDVDALTQRIDAAKRLKEKRASAPSA